MQQKPGGPEASRSDWIAVVTATAQSVRSAARGSTRLWTILADTARLIDPPRTPMERLFAAHTIERLAWTLLSEQTAAGHWSHAEAHAMYIDVVAVLDSATAWAELPAALAARERMRDERPLADRIRDHVDRHAAEPLTLPRIARALGVSVRRLTVEFRRRFGMTIHDYLTVRRLDEAVRLLVETDLKIVAVAARVGFRDQTALYRHLSRRVQLTPAEIRARSRRSS